MRTQRIPISYRRSRTRLPFTFQPSNKVATASTPHMALRATSVEVLRILISIGPTETMHFQTWSDKAGNAPALTAVDPVTGVSVTFPDLSGGGELFQNNLIMPEPCPFLNRSLPICSIIRPTQTEGIAMGVVSVPDKHGSLHRPIAGIFRIYAAAGSRRGQCHTWLQLRKVTGD